MGRDLWTKLLQLPTCKVVSSTCKEDENGEDQEVGGLVQSHPQALAAAGSASLRAPVCWQEDDSEDEGQSLPKRSLFFSSTPRSLRREEIRASPVHAGGG